MSTTTAVGAQGLTDEQRDFREAIRDFCQRECGSREQRDRAHRRLPRAPQPRASTRSSPSSAGSACRSPRSTAASGGGIVDAAIFLEETTRGLAPISGYGTSLIVAGAYERFGTDEQKQEMLGGIARGPVEAIAMSEPEAGSDVGNL